MAALRSALTDFLRFGAARVRFRASYVEVVAKTDPSIETVEREIAVLVEHRQELRTSGAESGELERNRRNIVARQHELSEALISIYAPQPAFALA